jgi:NADH:ubiquinone oxidoreductase subunit 6 (subunit J)
VVLIAFWIIAAVCVLSAAFVIAARNPVHSVLWLILAFFSAAGLLVLIGAEFLAMLLVVVYVGAVAVLFLFVVMMLDVDFTALRAGFTLLAFRTVCRGRPVGPARSGIGSEPGAGRCGTRCLPRRNDQC